MSVQEKTFQKIRSLKQNHILKHWDSLSKNQQAILSQQIESLDPTIFLQQQTFLLQPKPLPPKLDPFHQFTCEGHLEKRELGESLLSKGAMGCLIVAGGQGSRLQLDGPKGKYPTSVIKKKSLFQLFSEKTKAASKRYKQELPLTIMTSPLNHDETYQFFEENQFFNLAPTQISFFQQQTLPLLDSQGNLFLESPWKFSEGPNGNGRALHEFYHSGIWEQWWNKGIRHLNFLQIDNPLADPFDAELLGHHHDSNSDATIKCTDRQKPDEKVGIVINQNNKTHVIEYSEIPESELHATDEEGNFKHLCANLSLFCFNMEFIHKIAQQNTSAVPLHLAHKAVKYLDENGASKLAIEPNAWKFETFIFDVLSSAQNVNAVVYPREHCFAPLKGLNGPHSIHAVRSALFERERHLFASISGYLPDPDHLFELDQEFYYPSEQLIEFWHNRPAPKERYIVPYPEQ
ncbi:MAG: UDP-N-acetylglucosamine/UDP-N-acetylgalactosamine diphosphorylase [Chlamydiales bacterium]|jgi:UDP-N-acetylglucosamine/UDP-N-acetylgalactosamine diphosphorylase